MWKYHQKSKCSCQCATEKDFCHTVPGYFPSTKSKSCHNISISTSLLVLIMFLCGSVEAAKAKASDVSPRMSKTSLTEFSGNIIYSGNGPTFGKVPDSIEVMPGQTVILSCIVNNLGDRTVSWIRTADLQILTSGSITFTGDNRFSTQPTDDILSNCWGLMIRNVRYTDHGIYECQVNTEPKLKINITLIVREQLLMDRPFDGTTIDGPRINEIKSGSTITLTCRATISSADEQKNRKMQNVKDSTSRSKRVIWSVNNSPITLQIMRGGINVYTDWSLSEVISNLTLTNVTENDQGIYDCTIDDIGSDEIILYVVNDGKTSAGFTFASSSTSSSSYVPHSSLLFRTILVYIIICSSSFA